MCVPLLLNNDPRPFEAIEKEWVARLEGSWQRASPYLSSLRLAAASLPLAINLDHSVYKSKFGIYLTSLKGKAWLSFSSPRRPHCPWRQDGKFIWGTTVVIATFHNFKLAALPVCRTRSKCCGVDGARFQYVTGQPIRSPWLAHLSSYPAVGQSLICWKAVCDNVIIFKNIFVLFCNLLRVVVNNKGPCKVN